MTDQSSQPAPGSLTDIRQRSQADIDREDEAAALERIRTSAGLGESANSEILEHYGRVVRQEVETYGESETARRWTSRTENSAGWQEVERSLAADMRNKAKLFQRSGSEVQCQAIPADILKGRHPSQLSDRELQQAKEAMSRENDQRAAKEYRKRNGIPE